jgi:hypothetical protein
LTVWREAHRRQIDSITPLVDAFVVSQDVLLALGGSDLEQHRVGRAPLLLDSRDFIGLLIDREALRTLVGAIAGVSVDEISRGMS